MNYLLIIVLLLLIFLKLYIQNDYFGSVIKGYSDLQKDSIDITSGGISKIIIKTSWQRRSELPLDVTDIFKNIKIYNPDYQLYYFDDVEAEQFVKDYSQRAYLAYKKIIPQAFKADLFRICILEKYGGCYSDIGHSLIEGITFDKICGDANIVLVRDTILSTNNEFAADNYSGIHNALMCSVKNHDFFKLLIEKTCENIENGYYGEHPLDVTGPMMIGKQFNCFFSKICDNVNKNIMRYGYTNYNCKNCRVKILKFYKIPNDRSTILNGEVRFIVDNDNTILIKTKFDDYYNIMYYSRNIPRYSELWKNKKIFV